MPSFDAGSVVEGLDYTFAPFAASSGVITEPSDKQIGVFLSGLKNLMSGAEQALGIEGIDPADPDQVLKALDSLEPGEFVKVMTEMAQLHADLCSGKPSRADILKVPLRRRMLFFAWLQTEVMAPEAAPGGGNGQVRTLPSRAAG